MIEIELVENNENIEVELLNEEEIDFGLAEGVITIAEPLPAMRVIILLHQK